MPRLLKRNVKSAMGVFPTRKRRHQDERRQGLGQGIQTKTPPPLGGHSPNFCHRVKQRTHPTDDVIDRANFVEPWKDEFLVLPLTYRLNGDYDLTIFFLAQKRHNKHQHHDAIESFLDLDNDSCSSSGGSRTRSTISSITGISSLSGLWNGHGCVVARHSDYRPDVWSNHVRAL